MPGTYDAKLDTLYWTTSNAAPDFVGDFRPGDDLYTACVLALNPTTGALKWYFQFTPHDLYDYDANETPVLVSAKVNGRARDLLVQANRNGFLYVLDRTDGKDVYKRQTLGGQFRFTRRRPVRLSKGFGRARMRDRADRPRRSADRSSDPAHDSPGRRFTANPFSRDHAEQDRARH